LTITRLNPSNAYLNAPDIDSVRKAKLVVLGNKAESVANGGVVVLGNLVRSDDIAVANITSSLSLMARSASETIDFKFVGGWATVNKATLESFQDAIWELRKATYANHKLHEIAITALLSVQDIRDYDIDSGW